MDNELINLEMYLDKPRIKAIKEFKQQHPAQYLCIKEMGRKMGLEEGKRLGKIEELNNSYKQTIQIVFNVIGKPEKYNALGNILYGELDKVYKQRLAELKGAKE